MAYPPKARRNVPPRIRATTPEEQHRLIMDDYEQEDDVRGLMLDRRARYPNRHQPSQRSLEQRALRREFHLARSGVKPAGFDEMPERQRRKFYKQQRRLPTPETAALHARRAGRPELDAEYYERALPPTVQAERVAAREQMRLERGTPTAVETAGRLSDKERMDRASAQALIDRKARADEAVAESERAGTVSQAEAAVKVAEKNAEIARFEQGKADKRDLIANPDTPPSVKKILVEEMTGSELPPTAYASPQADIQRFGITPERVTEIQSGMAEYANELHWSDTNVADVSRIIADISTMYDANPVSLRQLGDVAGFINSAIRDAGNQFPPTLKAQMYNLLDKLGQ